MNDLFGLEETIIKNAESLLERENGNADPLVKEYADLLSNYRKLYKQIRRLIKINDKQQKKLNEANTILEKRSRYDELTGIYNRRMFNNMLKKEWRRCQRYNHQMSLLMLDIDHFKPVNDTYGHPAGDALLRHVAEIIQQAGRRAGDLAARYGGEEFVLLLPDTAPGQAWSIAERLRCAIEETCCCFADSVIRVTASIGLAGVVPDDKTQPEALIAMADKAMYSAKGAGRNRVCQYNPDSVEGGYGGR